MTDPTLPQSAFPYPAGDIVPGGPEFVVTIKGAVKQRNCVLFVNSGSVLALTLAAPVAGSPANGGEDGSYVTFVDVGGAAHTVTTPTNKINGAAAVATASGAKGNRIDLVAFNGVWYVDADATTWALT